MYLPLLTKEEVSIQESEQLAPHHNADPQHSQGVWTGGGKDGLLGSAAVKKTGRYQSCAFLERHVHMTQKDGT